MKFWAKCCGFSVVLERMEDPIKGKFLELKGLLYIFITETFLLLYLLMMRNVLNLKMKIREEEEKGKEKKSL